MIGGHDLLCGIYGDSALSVCFGLGGNVMSEVMNAGRGAKVTTIYTAFILEKNIPGPKKNNMEIIPKTMQISIEINIPTKFLCSRNKTIKALANIAAGVNIISIITISNDG